MGKDGIPELVIALVVGLTIINIGLLSIKKLINSKIPTNQKIRWIFTMIFFNIIGLIVFLVYHDNYLSPELRANP
jgi:hypothetical protein